MSTAPVSVVVRTIGRPASLAQALASLDRCDPRPAEVVVVDQGGEAAGAAGGSSLLRVRVVASRGRGPGLALNEGLRAAAHEVVLVLDDDCTAQEDWVGVGARAMAEVPHGIVTGQFVPVAEDPRRVPSAQEDPEPRDYTGRALYGVLWPGNMACRREDLLAFGGFDERITPAAEDCDLCYRWLTAGRTLRHVPELVVRHHGERTPEQLERLYLGYAYGRGLFYGKHLRQGDLRILRFAAEDLRAAARSLGSAAVRGTPRWSDPRRGIPRGLPAGMLRGLALGRPS